MPTTIQSGQKLAPFLYALTVPTINWFSQLFHCQNQEKICNNIPPHLKSLLSSVLKATIENKKSPVTTHFWEINIRIQRLLFQLLSKAPLPSNRQHLSYDVCLEVRGEIIRTVLCCIVYWSCAQSEADEMSSSYSSLDWVLSHWAHFTVCRFICVCVYLCFYVSYCIVVVSVWARWGGPDGIEA